MSKPLYLLTVKQGSLGGVGNLNLRFSSVFGLRGILRGS